MVRDDQRSTGYEAGNIVCVRGERHGLPKERPDNLCRKYISIVRTYCHADHADISWLEDVRNLGEHLRITAYFTERDIVMRNILFLIDCVTK